MNAKKLILSGKGYKASVCGNILSVEAGYSHAVRIPIPPGIGVAAQSAQEICICGDDKAAAGNFAALVRSIRKPNPYTESGIRYEREEIRLKAIRKR